MKFGVKFYLIAALFVSTALPAVGQSNSTVTITSQTCTPGNNGSASGTATVIWNDNSRRIGDYLVVYDYNQGTYPRTLGGGFSGTATYSYSGFSPISFVLKDSAGNWLAAQNFQCPGGYNH